jgi:peptide/nickel transport system substrate-binding protein
VGERNVRIVPDLATSWQPSPDGRTWTFHLRAGAKFHDGSPVNAAAVVYSFNRMLSLKCGAYSDFAEITRVTAVNPLTVRFRLAYPFSSFLASLTSLWGADVVNPKVARRGKVAPGCGASYLDSHDAGSGPYMLVRWQHKQRLVLKAFPGYWGGWHGNHATTVIFTWPASSSTQRLELERGGIDGTNNLTVRDFAAVQHESGIRAIERTAQTIRDIRINTTKGALQNRLVRQALNYAFDYQGVIRGVFAGHAAKMRGVGPTGLKNFVPAGHPYYFDLSKAQSLLKQSGASAKSLNFTIAYLPDDTQAIQMAQIFQFDLAKIGVKTKLQGIPIATYGQVDQKPSTDPDIWIGAWTMDYDDDAQMYYAYYYSANVAPQGGNVMFYKDPVTDRLINQALRARDPRREYHFWQEALYRVYPAAPNIWTVQPDDMVALRSTVHGYTYNFLYGSNYYPVYTMWRG